MMPDFEALSQRLTPVTELCLFLSFKIYSILDLVMMKRKPTRFSATKAVKSNARDRVGQPRPVKVIDTEPRTGREVKHKPKLDQIIQQEE